jgi:hypothetical protein
MRSRSVIVLPAALSAIPVSAQDSAARERGAGAAAGKTEITWYGDSRSS